MSLTERPCETVEQLMDMVERYFERTAYSMPPRGSNAGSLPPGIKDSARDSEDDNE